MIHPTVGRKVWYRPCEHDLLGPKAMMASRAAGAQPLDATIIAVWGDRMVNLLVTDTVGNQFPVLSCTLVQAGDTVPCDRDGVPHGRYAEWVPYQSAQAKKHEAADTGPTADVA